MVYPSIYHVYVEHLHIHGIFQAYSRHIPKIGVPDEAVEALEADRNLRYQKSCWFWTVCSCSDRAEQAILLSRHHDGGIMPYLFIQVARFLTGRLARCAPVSIGAWRCSSAKRRAAFTSLANSDPGHHHDLKARASRIRQHNKLSRLRVCWTPIMIGAQISITGSLSTTAYMSRTHSIVSHRHMWVPCFVVIQSI